MGLIVTLLYNLISIFNKKMLFILCITLKVYLVYSTDNIFFLKHRLIPYWYVRAGFVQFVVLFPLQKFVLRKEKKQNKEEENNSDDNCNE